MFKIKDPRGSVYECVYVYSFSCYEFWNDFSGLL